MVPAGHNRPRGAPNSSTLLPSPGYAGDGWAWRSSLESDSSPTHGHQVLPCVTRGR